MKKSFPEIKTNRLLLRQFSERDIENVFSGLSNPEVINYYGVSFKTIEETEEQMKWFQELEQSRTGIWWAVCLNDSKTFVGACGFNNLSEEHRKTEIGFWLLPEFWKRGIISEALNAIVDYGFNKLNLHRIEGFVEHGNTASDNVMKKNGFEYEGIMKDCEIKNGKFISLSIYAKLNPRENYWNQLS